MFEFLTDSVKLIDALRDRLSFLLSMHNSGFISLDSRSCILFVIYDNLFFLFTYYMLP